MLIGACAKKRTAKRFHLSLTGDLCKSKRIDLEAPAQRMGASGTSTEATSPSGPRDTAMVNSLANFRADPG